MIETPPPPGQRPSVPWGLPPGALDLIWYFSQGQTLCERSPMGPMIDAIRNRSCGSRRCARCNRPAPKGERVHLVDPEREGGTPGVLPDGSWCPACKGTGWVACAWKRARYAPTARTTGHEVRQAGYQADDRSLMRAAQVSRWVWWVKCRDSHAAQALEAYYGNDSGIGEATQWGALLGVMAITPAGRKLLRPSDGEGRPVERLRTIATLAGLGETAMARQAAMVAAADQAAALLRDAMELFGHARRAG